MMNCFPTIYKGELFYSLVARYKRMAGISNKKALRYDFYGKEVSLESVYFVVHAETIVSRLPINTKITAEDIIKNNSLYKVFTSFMDKEESIDILNKMKKEEGYNAFSKFGLLGSKVLMFNKLRYCYKCVEEDINEHGESYWRVIHQVPGALICEKHKIPLIESNVCSSNSRIEHICLDSIDIESKHYVLSDRIVTLNNEYISNIKYILGNSITNKSKKFYNSFIIDRLRDKGLLLSGSNIKIKEFESRFVEYYGQEYLELMQSGVDIENETNWLRRFIRNDNKKRHPLRYLLVLQFVGTTIEEYFNSEEVKGKLCANVNHNPRLDKEEQRKKWLKFLSENDGLSKSQLKFLGKGLYSWLYKNDNEWFNRVTPKRKNGSYMDNTKQWTSIDSEMLKKVKVAAEEILNYEGRPIKLTKSSIRRHLNEGNSFNNKKLIKTNKYINKVKESNEDYWKRKIEWAIKELEQEEKRVTVYNVQLKAGFGRSCEKEIKKLIEDNLIRST